MSRRKQLKVDTFPFLAVLLCAMGALILVLLVMDRRSKLAAQARAAEQMRRHAEDEAIERVRRREEYEAKQQARKAEWNRKRQELTTRVDAEEKQLDGEMRQVQARLAEAAARLRDEEENVRKLRAQVKEEQERLQAQEKTLDTVRSESGEMARKLAEADKARAKMAADLAHLEQLLRKTQEARKQETKTYSVIPYKGTRGDSRRPIYVECNEDALLFHPDRLKLDSTTEASRLRAEVKRRIEEQKQLRGGAAGGDTRPYLLLLVRPNGVRRYYELQAAVKDLDLDFGYEFVDADWVLKIDESAGDTNAAVARNSERGVPTTSGGGSTGLPGTSRIPGTFVSHGQGGTGTGGSVSGTGTGTGTVAGVSGKPGTGTGGSGMPGTGTGQGPNLGGIGNAVASGTNGNGMGTPGVALSGPGGSGEVGAPRGTGVGTGTGPQLSGGSGAVGGIGSVVAGGVGGGQPGMGTGGGRPGMTGTQPGGGSPTPVASSGLPGQGPTLGGGTATGSGMTPGMPNAPRGGMQQPSGVGSNPGSGTVGGTGGAMVKAPTGGVTPGFNPGTRPMLGSSTQPHPDAPIVSMHRPVSRPTGEQPVDFAPPSPLPSYGKPEATQVAPGAKDPAGQPVANQGAGVGNGSGGKPMPVDPRQPKTGQGLLRNSPTANPEPPARRSVPLRPGRIDGGDEAVVYVECRADHAIIYPMRQVVSLDDLTNTPPYNPLTQAVTQLITRRLSMRKSGEPAPRFQVRFLLHPDGLRTYHRAYPALDTVAVPKTRYNLMPDDDVARIVAGY